MKNGVSKGQRWLKLLETGLLIVIVAGIIISIQTQQVVWGLIPIALTIILNQINQNHQQRSQQQQFQKLESLIQNCQAEEENQQINLWKLQKQIEEWQDFLIDFRETNAQNTQTLEEIIAELSQVQPLREKQNNLNTQMQKIAVTQEQLITDFNHLSQVQETLSQSVTELSNQVHQDSRDDAWEYSLQQTNERLSYLHQLQNKQHQNDQEVAIELKESLATVKEEVSQLREELNQKTEVATRQSSNEDVRQLQNQIEEMTETFNLLNQRQREENDYYQKAIEQFREDLESLREQINWDSQTELDTIHQLVQENQQQQTQLTNEISQLKTDYQTLAQQLQENTSERRNNTSIDQEIERLQSYLKQVTQLLDSVVKRQAEEKKSFQTKIEQLHHTLESVISENQSPVNLKEVETIKQSLEQTRQKQGDLDRQISQIKQHFTTLQNRSFSQDGESITSSIIEAKINHFHDYLKQLTDLLDSLAQRQTEENQALKARLSHLQSQLTAVETREDL
ncbi:hypothetical protein PCC7418_1977 [Halothece sp. PCC 7418]|nr:hypothetical protein PCC7418_1977 [Halothece sp. PCC 7418]